MDLAAGVASTPLDLRYLLFLQDFRIRINDALTPMMETISLFAVTCLIMIPVLVYWMLDKKSGAFIGNVELMDPTDSQAELGIAITAKMQDRGCGTEAVRTVVAYGMEKLGLRRIFLKVYPDNARAIRCYEKCGFREYDRTDEDVFMEITGEDGEKGESA